MSELSIGEQQLQWQGITKPRAELPPMQPAPLAHLPCVAWGCSLPEGIWRFKIVGEVAFRDKPADLAALAAGAKEIHVEIDTAGGDGRWALEFGTLLRATGAKIICTARRGFSAGALLLQAGDVRRVHRDGGILVHGPQTACIGSAEEHEAIAAWMRKERATDVELLTFRTKQTPAIVEGWLSQDSYFTPQQAFEVGLVDEVVD